MKNALDEIECIPTIGGIKPPYPIHSHPYCVDIITTYVQLSKLRFKKKGGFLKKVEEGIRFYCASNEIDFNYHFDNKLPLIISPTVNNFQWFLGLQIIGFDINKIKALLSFQQKRFLNEDADYITFVEFAVYRIVHNFTLINNTERLRTIMEWVNEQRFLNINSGIANTKGKEIPKVNKKVKTTKPRKIKIIIPSFTLISSKPNSNYFPDSANNFMNAFKLLKGGGFIAMDSDFNKFKNIFIGEIVKRENKIEWTGHIKDLNRFVTFLMKDKIKKIRNNKWETACNCFKKDDADILPDNLRQAKSKEDNVEKLHEIINTL